MKQVNVRAHRRSYPRRKKKDDEDEEDEKSLSKMARNGNWW